MDKPIPTRRGRPARAMPQPIDRLTQLEDRERAHAIKARARKRYTFDMPLEMYEALLDQAEAWDVPLPDVVRASIRSGLDTIKRYGGATPTNPFAYGQLNPPTQAQLDPTGLAWPSPPIAPVFENRTAWNDLAAMPLPLRTDLPMPMRITAPIKPGMLPNGATVSNAGPPNAEVSSSVSPFEDDSPGGFE